MRFSGLIFLLLSFTVSFCQLHPTLNNNAGNIDTNAAGATIFTAVPDPVLTSSAQAYITFTKGPITGFVSGDLTVTNCTVSNFTKISDNQWSFVLNPTIDGVFTAKLNSSTCFWTSNNGTSIANNESNTLSKTYNSGASYDLENAAEISAAAHYRGHTASFTQTNDYLSTISTQGMELLMTKYNQGFTNYTNGNNVTAQRIFQFGRADFGIISQSFADFLVRKPLIYALRGNQYATVASYKNGDDSYSASVIAEVLSDRNSETGSNPPAYTNIAYTGLTDVALSALGSSFRYDHYNRVTTTSYYTGPLSTGDTRHAQYVAQVLSTGGWFTNFVHHHWQVGNYPKHYLQQLEIALGSADVFRGTVNQIVEYYYVRESVDSIIGNGNTITVYHTEDFLTSPYENITTPLWIKLDVTGTVFEGEELALSNGLLPRKVSSNVFYIPVVLDYTGNQTTVSVGIATIPAYVNLDQPVVSRVGNTVTCDQEVLYSVWRVPKPTALATSVTGATIPTLDNTTISLTVGTGLTIPTGRQVRVAYNESNYFYAIVTSYTSGTGALVLASFPDAVGSGSYSDWTITTYYHELAATEVERSFVYATSYAILSVLDESNYTYHIGVINRDKISNAIP